MPETKELNLLHFTLTLDEAEASSLVLKPGQSVVLLDPARTAAWHGREISGDGQTTVAQFVSSERFRSTLTEVQAKAQQQIDETVTAVLQAHKIEVDPHEDRAFATAQVNSEAERAESVEAALAQDIAQLSTDTDAKIAAAIAGAFNFRDEWSPSSGDFPATGGSGSGGAIRKGNLWISSADGVMHGLSVDAGDMLVAKVNTPGQTAANWMVLEHNILQATEATAGSIKLATQANAESQITTDNVSAMTPVRSWQQFVAGLLTNSFLGAVRGAVLTGLSTVTNAVITMTDTIEGALGKLQAQITAHSSNTSNPHGVTKSQVGLGSVDNTSDVGKPVSTATQTALDLKANIASPTFTGTPAAPTPAHGTNTTQLATTGYVLNRVGLPVALAADVVRSNTAPGQLQASWSPALAVSRSYKVKYFGRVLQSGTSSSFTFSLTVPTGATANWTVNMGPAGGTMQPRSGIETTTITQTHSGGSTEWVFEIEIVVNNSTTAGSLILVVSANSTNANTYRKNSWMTVEEQGAVIP